jgi:hypothetical protein
MTVSVKGLVSPRYVATIEVREDVPLMARIVDFPAAGLTRLSRSPAGFAWYDLFTEGASGPFVAAGFGDATLQRLVDRAAYDLLPGFQVIGRASRPGPDESVRNEGGA